MSSKNSQELYATTRLEICLCRSHSSVARLHSRSELGDRRHGAAKRISNAAFVGKFRESAVEEGWNFRPFQHPDGGRDSKKKVHFPLDFKHSRFVSLCEAFRSTKNQCQRQTKIDIALASVAEIRNHIPLRVSFGNA